MNGILNVYKEKGYTSFDVVAKLRGITKQKKIGHTGTLDPDAEGVLPVCFGSATKLCDLLMDKRKEYVAEFVLGITTDTQDMTGQIVARFSTEDISVEELQRVVLSFCGEYEQIPPMYSALKVNGKKLYELAREGIEIERKSRNVTISQITIEKIELPYVTIRVECSKGTYIRTLCHDIGQVLGCGAAMNSLIRTRSGQFLVEEALTIDQWKERAAENGWDSLLISPDSVFMHYPAVYVQDQFQKLADNGNTLCLQNVEAEAALTCQQDQMVRLYRSGGGFYGIYEWKAETGLLKPVKMMFDGI